MQFLILPFKNMNPAHSSKKNFYSGKIQIDFFLKNLNTIN